MQTIKYYNLKILDYEQEGEYIVCEKNFTYMANIKTFLKMLWNVDINKIHLGTNRYNYYWIEVSEETLILDDYSK